MFGRDKQPPPAPVEERPGAKNRPTPKRAEAEAANRRPLVPGDHRGSRRAARAAARSDRAKTRAAMVTGDEANLPERDKGPMRRFVRDYVDARRNVGEYFLVVALVVVVVGFLRSPQVQLVTTGLLWATVIACLVDGYLLTRSLSRALRERFPGEELPKGIMRYGVLRAFQIRRTRLPKPMVDRGQLPR